MLKATFHKKTFRFTEVRKTSRNSLTTKESWFIVVYNINKPSIKGIGECSYLKGLSPENEMDYESKILEICENINNYAHYLNGGLDSYPSIQFGLETAMLDLKVDGNKKLFDSTFNKGEPILINGLVWMNTYEEMSAEVNKKVKEKFGCIKIKIGAIDFENELKLIRRLREKNPNIIIRLDANGAFTFKEALQKLTLLSQYNIHSIEQPIKQKQLTKLAELIKVSPIKIALDEELIGINTILEKQKLLKKCKPHFIVLKPSLTGGIKGTLEWINIAEKLGIKWWITSCLESDIGLNAIAQFTASLNTSLAQGLGTGKLYSNNFKSGLYLKGDKLFHDATKWNNYEL